YQPHPAFATDARGKPLYPDLGAADVSGVDSPMGCEHLGSRELVAADYVYQIKRLADPSVTSPIFSLMAVHIQGLKTFSEKVGAAREALGAKQGKGAFLDLGTIDMVGVQVVDRYTYQVTRNGRYPQFK